MAEKKLNILSAEAHIDDSTYLYLAHLLNWAAKGHNIDIAVFTDSDAQGLGKKRINEQMNIMGHFSFRNFYPIGYEKHYPDGRINLLDHYECIKQDFKEVLDNGVERNEPYDVVITLDNTGGGTMHPDHLAVWNAVQSTWDLETDKYGANWTQLYLVTMSMIQISQWQPYFIAQAKYGTPTYNTTVDSTPWLSEKILAIEINKTQLKTGGALQIERIKKYPFEHSNKLIR